MLKYRIFAFWILVAGALLSWLVFATNTADSRYTTKLGLDLAGGTQLVYRADTANLAGQKDEVLAALREVVERRVNLFGVAEPLVQVERSSAVAGEAEDRLLVELPGVTDVDAAVAALGQTPLLEFKLGGEAVDGKVAFMPTPLTGRYLKNAELQFGAGNGRRNEPVVVLHFTDEGAALFEKITSEHVGKTLAIFLDGQPISTPVIREAIAGGTAVVSGNFTPAEARDLVKNLNFGALPVAITLTGSGTVGPTLGAAALKAGEFAGMLGFLLITLFMVLWYRLPGLVASISLAIYVAMNIALIKFIPITLTASGIAGFILSIGMAVDANVLIFERVKEELRKGVGTREALRLGFKRAWPAIRDGHFTMLISSIILFWLGTSVVQGFALVFGLGIITSLLSAITLTRVMLLAILPEKPNRVWRFLVGSGLRLTNHD